MAFLEGIERTGQQQPGRWPCERQSHRRQGAGEQTLPLRGRLGDLMLHVFARLQQGAGRVGRDAAGAGNGIEEKCRRQILFSSPRPGLLDEQEGGHSRGTERLHRRHHPVLPAFGVQRGKTRRHRRAGGGRGSGAEFASPLPGHHRQPPGSAG